MKNLLPKYSQLLKKIEEENSQQKEYDTIVYLRISTDKQDFASQYEAAKNFQIPNSTGRIYLVDIESGTNSSREKLQLALKLIRTGKIKNFVVPEVSRLTRDTDFAIRFSRLLKKFNVNFWVVSLGQKIDVDNPYHMLSYVISASTAETEVMQLRGRVISGQKTAINKGRPTWAAPFGFTKDPVTHKLIPQKKEARIIEFIFQNIANGVSCNKLSKKLSQEMKKGKFAPLANHLKILTPHYIRYFISCAIRRPEYMGTLVWNRKKWEEAKIRYWRKRPLESDASLNVIVMNNVHPAIVDEDLWYKANEALDRNDPLFPNGDRSIKAYNRSPLYGKVICGHHRKILSIKRKSWSEEYIFVCEDRTCANMPKGVKELEKEVIDKISELVDKRIIVKKEEMLKEAKKELEGMKEELKEKEKSVKNIDEEISLIMEKFETQQISKDAFINQIKKLKKEKEELETQMIFYEHKIKVTTKEIESLESEIPQWLNFRNLYFKKNVEEKRALLDKIIDRIALKNNKMEVLLK